VPIVTVELWSGRTVDEKRRMVESITEMLVDQLDLPPETFHVVIRDVPKENWGHAGVLACDLADASSA
jgi:4-oxalocrotonate tautomerase